MTNTQNNVVDLRAARPSALFAAVDNESLSEGIGASYGVLHYKGKNWSLAYRGNKHLFLRPDDGTPLPYIDVVILRQAKVKAKSYYPGGFNEDSSSGTKPTCASIDGIAPDSDVPIETRQSTLCAVCKRNEWRTDANGRKGRECTDYKRLAVLLLPTMSGPLFAGQPLLEPVFLRVPPDSLQDLGTYGDGLSSQGYPYCSVVTRITFDPSKSHPKFLFRVVQVLGDAEAKVVVQMREEALSKRVTGEDEIAKREEARKQPQISSLPTASIGLIQQPLEPAPTQQAQQPTQQAQVIDMQQTSTGWGTPPAPEPMPSNGFVSTVGQTAEDVGEVEDDGDLDAQIAKLMATS